MVQGEVEHKRVKKFYPRTQKRQFTQGIAKQQRRERLLHLISQSDPYLPKPNQAAQPSKVASAESELSQVKENLPPLSPYEHHQMSTETASKINVIKWLSDNHDDPALKVYLPSWSCKLIGTQH